MVLVPIIAAAAAINSLLVLALAARITEHEEAQAAREPMRSPDPVEAVTGL